MKPEVSVVIPTYNRRKLLLRAIASLPKDVEIIVVDDGSTDGTAEAVRAFDHPNLIVLSQKNAGPGAARNNGIRIASGRIIAFMDDDCIAIPPWPWNLVQRLDKESDKVAAVGGGVLPFHKGAISRYNTYYHILEPTIHGITKEVMWVITANCGYQASVLREVGGFPSHIRTAGGEEIGLAVVVKQRGYTFVFEPSAALYHDYRESLWNFVKTFYTYGKGTALAIGWNFWTISPSTIFKTLFLSWRRNLKDGVPFMDAVFFFPVLRTIGRICVNLGWQHSLRRMKKEQSLKPQNFTWRQG